MIFFNKTVIFKLKPLRDSLDDCKKRIEFSTNNYEINIMKEVLRDAESNFEALSKKYNDLVVKAENDIEKLEKFWDDHKVSFLSEIDKLFGLSKGGDRQFVCLLGVEPIPYFDYYNRTITLPMNEDFETNLTTFVSYVMKSSLLSKIWGNDACHVDLTYSKYNLRWIMADFVSDAIMFNSSLKKLNILPAYKYFYTLEINGNNLVESFRNMYKMYPIKEFLMRVLSCVKDNYQVFRRFSNRY